MRLLFNATPLIDDGGNTIGTTGTATDVTERTRATLALQQQRETLRQVIDIIPYPIFSKNSQGTVLLANQAFCSLFGKSTEEVIGSDYRLINRSLEIAERHIAEDIQVIQTRQPFFTAEEMVPNEQSGELHWFQTIKVPMLTTGSNEVSALGVAIDITERKRAEEALRATVEGTASATAEHFFNSLVQHLAEALATKIAYVGKLVTEGDRKYIQVLSIWNGNSHAEQFCFPIEGTPSAEVVAKGFRHLTKVAENYPDRPWFKENKVSDYLGMPIFTGSGQPLGILAVLHDSPVADRQITRTLLSIFAARAGAEIERLEAEESRAALQRQLLQSQKMEAIGQLAAGVAHDLNNALGAVVGHLQLIKLDLDEHSPLGPSLEVALKGCSRATSLIGQLLGFSRQGKYNPKIIRIRDAVKETLDFVSKIIGKDLKIDFQSQLNDLPIKADPAQLQQVLINLLINAKQAMPNGGSIFIDSFVSDQLAPQQFNSKATPGTYAVIRIRDTGTGIPREHLDKIFEPFFTTKSEGRGTGLGLPMAYGIMQNHGGWIGLESKVGEGTAFSLYFPLCQTNALPAETSGVITSSKSHGTVMVVDDEQYLVTLSKTFLEREGLLVHGFTSPHEAIGWYRMNWREIDLVVLDMKMPGIDGSQCFDEIKKINQHAVIIMLSGYIHDELAQSLLVRGARAFFSKHLE